MAGGKFEAWLILLTLLFTVLASYWLLWRGKRIWVRRLASVILAGIAALAAYTATFGYVLRFADFRDDMLGSIIAYAVCLAAWAIAVRFAVLAVRTRLRT
jgi:hypothetical protein